MKHFINKLRYQFYKLIFTREKPKVMQRYSLNNTLPLNLAELKEILYYLFMERSGYQSALNRDDQTLAGQNIFLTYGEILPEGMAKLMAFVKPTANDSFVDLGAGVGKAVLQSYLCTDMQASYGVEIDNTRCELSTEALAELKQAVPKFFNNKAKIIEFQRMNIIDFNFDKVSIVFCNATCFGPNLMSKIATKINNSPSVRALLTTCRVEGLVGFTAESIVDIEVSWHMPPGTSPCYVYTKL